jgi:citrate lyase subunit beta/citryl-CoA lyase
VPNPFVRSKLFVPGARPELFPKALASAADAVSFDLEDAVAPEHKAQARTLVAAAVRDAARLPLRPLLIVRVNELDSPWFDDDMRVVAAAGPDWINLPKVASAADVRRAVVALDAAAATSETGTTGRLPVGLLLNIETAAALQHAADIAAAHPRVVGLQLGLADLFEPLGIDRHDPANVHAAMFALRMAAGVANVFAVDGAYPDMADEAGFRAEAAMARRLGFVGKSCIHPRQVAWANEAFSPSAAELTAARRLVDAARAAEAAGRGAFTFDGRMVDAPFVQRARALLATVPESSSTE